MVPFLTIYELLVYILFAACLIGAWRRGRFEALELIWTTLYGFLLEWVTIQLLHVYFYGPFVLMFDGTPLCIAMTWAVIIYTSMQFSSRLQVPDGARPLIDALLALNVDLALDVTAIRLRLWTWNGIALNQQWFGVPWANFWAWGGVVWSFSAFLRALRPWREHRIRRWLYPPVAMALSLGVLVAGMGVYQFIASPDQQAVPTLFLLAGCVLTLFLLRPRMMGSDVPERITILVPLAFHAFALIVGLLGGIFSGQPLLAGIGLAMLALTIALHRWPSASV